MRNKNNSLSNQNIQAGLQERIHQVMNVAVTRELENIEKNIGFFEMLESILLIFDIFGHICIYFDNGKVIFRPVSSFSQILGPLPSIFDHFMAIFILLQFFHFVSTFNKNWKFHRFSKFLVDFDHRTPLSTPKSA